MKSRSPLLGRTWCSGLGKAVGGMVEQEARPWRYCSTLRTTERAHSRFPLCHFMNCCAPLLTRLTRLAVTVQIRYYKHVSSLLITHVCASPRLLSYPNTHYISLQVIWYTCKLRKLKLAPTFRTRVSYLHNQHLSSIGHEIFDTTATGRDGRFSIPSTWSINCGCVHSGRKDAFSPKP